MNTLSKGANGTTWIKVFPSVVPMTISKCQNAEGYFIRVSATKDQEVYGIEINLPISRMKKTSDCFLQWRDKEYGGAWGLNFVSEKDIKKFLKMCVIPSEDRRRKSSSLTNISSVADSSKFSSVTDLSSSAGSSNFPPPKIFISSDQLGDSGIERDKKPTLRKPLIPKRSDSHDSGNSNSFSVTDDLVPTGFDATEYEYLTKQESLDENDNIDDLNLSLGLSASGRTPSNASLYVPLSCDDSQSGVSEDFQDTRPPSAIVYNRQIMTTRKAAWLIVKNVLIHSKKGKVEVASHRKWKKYWVALKGIEMLFYHADEKTVTTDDLDEPSYRLDVDCSIVQAVPEYTRLENVFSLSSKHGNAYYLQATSQTEVDNWIHCIHSAAAMAMARKKGLENITVMLKQEIDRLNEALLSDERLKKMAILQLKMEKETQMKHSITEQILSWEHSLEFQHATLFRLRCYLSAVEGSSNPNPQDLLMHISRATKHALSKIGIFSVTSFHSFVNARNAILPPTEEKPKRGRARSSGLKARLFSSLKIADDNVVSAIRSRHSPKIRHKKASSNDSSDVESNSSSSRSGQKLHGRIGNKLHVQLPSGNTTVIPYESNLKISDLMERVCMKEKLDSSDFFIMLMVDDNNHHGLLDYTIPKEKAVLELFQYSSIKLCAKFVFDVTLSDPADYEHGAFGLELQQTLDERIIVTFVEEGSPARKLGILVDDEVIEINGQNLRDMSNSFNDIKEVLNTSASIAMKLRSKRVDDPKKAFQTTDNMISFLVCPPPPKTMQPDLSDDILSSLIVPAPTDFDEDGGSIVTTRSYDHNKSTREAKVGDIDNFLQQTEKVNMMTREMNAVVSEKPAVPAKMKPGVKLKKAIIELLETEKTYVKNLKILLERYLIPLKEENFLSKDEAELLVTNVREIYDFQMTFFDRLKEIVRSERGFDKFSNANEFQNVLYLIGETFLEYVHKFKLYSTFCSCHSRAVKLLELNTNEDLKAFLIARNPKQQHTGTLESYLITPIQRILRYPLLMKSMMKLMVTDSDEYQCLHGALKSVEKVADYINEMQRISETYTPIFQEMCEEYIWMEKADMGVDNLLHYGRVQWLNGVESLCKRNSYTGKQDDAENLTIFIFKKAVVLLSYDPKLRKKMSPNSSMNLKTSAEIKFHVLIPLSNLLLRDHAWSENDTDQVWEIVDASMENEESQTVYKFVNRTGEEKKVFVNAIKEAKKINKFSNSFPVLASNKHPNKNRLKLSTSHPSKLSSTSNNDSTEDIKSGANCGTGVKKRLSFSKKDKPSRHSSGIPSPKPFKKLSHRILGK